MDRNNNRENIYLFIAAAFAFIAMVLVNILSETLPIAGVTNAEVSDSYPSLFTPTGLTFSIWGVIYLMLAIYTIWQFGKKNREVAKDVGLLYILSSVLNIAWIFTWHYKMLMVSFLVIAMLLATLIFISWRLERASTLARIPFGIYYGWITVATIANLMIVLNANFESFGGSLLEIVMTCIAIVIAGIIGAIRIKYKNDYYYGAAIVWSAIGIILNQIKLYDATYIAIILSAILSIGIVVFSFIMNVSDSKGRFQLSEKTL